jgi:sulfite exporter TauE/SafE
MKLGMIAVITGIVGAGFGVGGVENSVDNVQLFQSIGVAFTSLLLMQIGVWMIKDEI